MTTTTPTKRTLYTTFSSTTEKANASNSLTTLSSNTSGAATGLSTGVIMGLVFGVLVALAIIIVFVVRCQCKRNKPTSIKGDIVTNPAYEERPVAKGDAIVRVPNALYVSNEKNAEVSRSPNPLYGQGPPTILHDGYEIPVAELDYEEMDPPGKREQYC
eukprot:m.125833 g.125833  ORF g.125833 m.125833 type:complete len:159 (+) comp14501_c1_seq2:1276-1752(+)